MDARGVKPGMTVRSVDGEKLGKVIACEADRFFVEKGFFFPKDYLVRYGDVAEVRGDEVLLRQSRAELGGERADAGAWASGERAGSEGTERAGIAAGTTEQVTVPVAEEELSAEKRTRQAGEVAVHKTVTTERRDISVPVTKEEVHVEREPAHGEAARPGDATFRDETVRVPVREEEVEIHKRPVVREQVRISKTSHEQERRASEDVRREDVDVEKGDDVELEGPGRREPE
jgi:uncharacterized protein (TIGR02271 family)